MIGGREGFTLNRDRSLITEIIASPALGVKYFIDDI
jgi:hypothetical protein